MLFRSYDSDIEAEDAEQAAELFAADLPMHESEPFCGIVITTDEDGTVQRWNVEASIYWTATEEGAP